MQANLLSSLMHGYEADFHRSGLTRAVVGTHLPIF